MRVTATSLRVIPSDERVRNKKTSGLGFCAGFWVEIEDEDEGGTLPDLKSDGASTSSVSQHMHYMRSLLEPVSYCESWCPLAENRNRLWICGFGLWQQKLLVISLISQAQALTPCTVTLHIAERLDDVV